MLPSLVVIAILPQYWGDHFVCPLRDILEEACAHRDVADCEFFINKRDYPQLKFNPNSLEPVEPYGFIYNKDDRYVRLLDTSGGFDMKMRLTWRSVKLKLTPKRGLEHNVY